MDYTTTASWPEIKEIKVGQVLFTFSFISKWERGELPMVLVCNTYQRACKDLGARLIVCIMLE
jgi:hypothetical protein